jgi:hypothetical protein
VPRTIPSSQTNTLISRRLRPSSSLKSNVPVSETDGENLRRGVHRRKWRVHFHITSPNHPSPLIPKTNHSPGKIQYKYTPHSRSPVLLYIRCPTPWNGEKIPLTLSFQLDTGLLIFFNFVPCEFRSSSAFCRTWLCSRLRTQMTFSRPLTRVSE